MKITKYGLCCLLIEEAGLRILTDPGSYTIEEQSGLKGIDIILITHEHQDHFHVESVKKILANNPQAKIITNASVGALLDKEGIAYSVVADGQKTTEKKAGAKAGANDASVSIEGIGLKHAPIYPAWPPVENTGYLLAGRLFYPGDAFTDPKRPIEILALPVAAPWLKFSEVADYLFAVRPKRWFGVHDGMVKGPNFIAMMLDRIAAAPPEGIAPLASIHIPLEIGKETDLG